MPSAPYAPFMKQFPLANLPAKEITAHVLSDLAGGGQAVFFEMQAGAVIAPHSHDEQWGVVVDGELDFTMEGTTRRNRGGDSYYVPAGVTHSAVALTACRVIEVFKGERFKPKSA